MNMTDKKITDEMLKQRWMEWGCEEKLVDHIIKRFKDMEIPEISFGSFYGYTYDNESEFRWAMSGWKSEIETCETDETVDLYPDDNTDDTFDEEIDIELCSWTTGRHRFLMKQIIKNALDEINNKK